MAQLRAQLANMFRDTKTRPIELVQTLPFYARPEWSKGSMFRRSEAESIMEALEHGWLSQVALDMIDYHEVQKALR